MLKTFVCFHLPNDEFLQKEVETRSVTPADIPAEAIAYEFFDMQVVEAEDGELCYGEPRNRSEVTFVSAVIFSRNELEEIIKNMQDNSAEKVIITPSGEYLFYYDEDEDYRFVSYPDLLNQ